MKTLRLLLIPILVAFIALISASIFVVKETERAVKLRFGEVVEADVPPGLHFKLPIINTVRKFDARILTLDAAPQSYLTSEKKALTVDSFVKWRVEVNMCGAVATIHFSVSSDTLSDFKDDEIGSM